MVAYSRLMGADEAGTLAALKALIGTLIEPLIGDYNGRIVKLMGDGILAEFASVVDGVECAYKIQTAMLERGRDVAGGEGIVFRIGVNLGDLIIDGDDIYGDGVNIAARLEGLAEPGGICISSVVFDQIKNKLDLSFVDLGPQQVKNISEPLRVYAWQNEATVPATFEPTTPLPDTPSIAVLPFQNMSGDPEQEYFCNGLVEDIITTLSKLGGLRVIARNSTFAYKGQSVDVRQAAKQLGVQYVLEGSVRKSGARVRITAQLIDASDGTHLWAERYDRALDDIFAIQDEMTLVLAMEMQVKLTEGEQARLRYTTASTIEVWSHWVEGLSYYRKSVTKENTAGALACWNKALALEPQSATLNAMMGFMHLTDARFGWFDAREAAISKGRNFAESALELDRENPDANTTAALAELFQKRFEDAAGYARRAVQLAPGSADAATFACFVLAFAGYPDEAVVHGETAMVLNPNYPGYYLGQLGNAYRLAGRLDKAIDAFEEFHARHPGFGLSDLVIIFHEPAAGRCQKKREQLLTLRPDFTIASWRKTQFRSDQVRLEADIAALGAAGLPMG